MNILIHMPNVKLSSDISVSNFSEISVELFKQFIHMLMAHCEPPIKHSKSSKILIILLIDVLSDDLWLRLHLQHLYYEAYERAWLLKPSITASNVLKVNSFID